MEDIKLWCQSIMLAALLQVWKVDPPAGTIFPLHKSSKCCEDRQSFCPTVQYIAFPLFKATLMPDSGPTVSKTGISPSQGSPEDYCGQHESIGTGN